jgi:Do/DeqQ family serine protease
METQADHIINTGRHQRRRNWTILRLIGAGVLFTGAIFGSVAMAKGWFGNGGGEMKVPIYVSSDTKINEQITLSGGFSSIAKAVTPAVVVITVKSRVNQQRAPFFDLDPFRDFFDRPDQDEEGTPRRRPLPRPPQTEGRRPLLPSGTGSGVIVSPDGYILTNNHVVDGAEKIEVEVADKRVLEARLIGADPPSDLAVIKVEGSNFPTIPFGDSSQVQVGDLVLAVGNPLGIGQTVTMGIISAKGRTTARGNPQSQPYEDFLQTDAAINRGNSGGALVNLRGELVGIPSQILAGGTGGNIGIGFAIPSSMARGVLDQLLRNGKVRRGKLGVFVTGVTPEIAEQFGYKGTAGALVQDVVKGEPADQAGVKPGDIITEFQGQRIQESSQLRTLASQTAPDTSVKFKVWRDGAERELSAKLAEVNPKVAENKTSNNNESNSASGLLSGIRVENLTPENTRALRLPDNARGVVIVEVDPESNAYFSGLRRGTVIEEIAKQPVNNINEFNAAMQKLGDRKSVLLRVRDASGARFVVVQSQE